MLDQGRSLGEYITRYRLKYFIPHPSGFGWKIRPGAEEEIYERIEPLALRMAGEDYLELPELIFNNIRVDLPPDALKLYLQMEADLIASIEDKVVTAATAGVASGKMRQIANGGIYLDPVVQTLVKQASKREAAVVHNAKTEALADLVDELQGSPLLVAYDFNHDLERLRAKFPDAVFVADYSMKEFSALEAKWNRGEISLMFGHAQSIGHGLNLQECGHHVAWYALTWNFEDYDQFIRRVYRQGNKFSKVFVHHFIAAGTIDEIMLMSIKAKDKTQKALFTGLQELAKLRQKARVS